MKRPPSLSENEADRFNEREEWASARDSMSESDRAYDYDDMH